MKDDDEIETTKTETATATLAMELLCVQHDAWWPFDNKP
jgi:hypothetical protein